jgi:hypothetical protein
MAVQRRVRRVHLRMRVCQLDTGITNVSNALHALHFCSDVPMTRDEIAESADLMRYSKQLQALRAEAAADLRVLDMQIAAGRGEVRT